MGMALKRLDPTGFVKLREPWEQADYRRLGQIAHQWKGSCAYVSAMGAQRAALKLEKSAKALGDAADSATLRSATVTALCDLQVELRRVMPALQQALEQL